MTPPLPDTSLSRPFQPPRSGLHRAVVASLLLLAAAAGTYFWWQGRASPPVAPATPAAAPATIAAADSASAPPPEPAIQHPIDNAAATTPALPPLDQADAAVASRLTALLGAKAVTAMLQTDGFVRRVTASDDNLDRAHAAPRLWPVAPMAGKFSVQQAGGVQVIAPSNAARYAPFVKLVESVDAGRAAAVYVSLYPLFQQAYQELGYPRGYFNDRLVAVIDRLLATPEPAGPLAVRLTEVKGPIESDRPWVRYEFVDPALDALPAGSKMLLRMGPDHARVLKTKLAELRRAIAKAPAGKP